MQDVQIERVASCSATGEERVAERQPSPIRPKTFADYPGQGDVKHNLQIYVQAARKQNRPLDHTLLHGPPGLGKTTLAHILAHELAVPFCSSTGPALDKPGDLAGILTGIAPGTLVFIDEIHRLPIKVEEMLYSAMEDFFMDVVVGQGPTARTLRVPVEPFTLVGATTRVSLVSKPMLGRFGIQERLEFYDEDALMQILQRSASVLKIGLSACGARAIATRSRGTPRLANRLLKRVWDHVVVSGANQIDASKASGVLTKQGFDAIGLDRLDRQILRVLADQYQGGPAGIDAIAATINTDRGTIEDVYEPFLVHKGLIGRGPRGRFLTPAGATHAGCQDQLAGRPLF